MKFKGTISVALGLLLAVRAYPATPVTAENSWTESYAVTTPSPQLLVSNVWGSVTVRNGDSGEISVSVVEVRSAPDRRRYDLSLDIIRLDIEADSSGLSIVVGDRNERGHRMDECGGCRLDYQFEIQVPPGTTLDVGTVIDGKVDIRGVTGLVSASNVNGPIRIDGLQDCETINSANGRVDLQYSRAPVRDCSIETINGDVTLTIPTGSDMDVALDLFNGRVESEFQVSPFSLPTTVEHEIRNGHNQYRIQQLSGVRIGAGGPTYSIASMNGDVRIQKHQ
jgi:hypothetical protein